MHNFKLSFFRTLKIMGALMLCYGQSANAHLVDAITADRDKALQAKFETNRDMAVPTDEQLARLDKAMALQVNDPLLNKAMIEAKNTILQVLITAACQTRGFDLAAGDAISPEHKNIAAIIPYTASPKTECYNINRTGGWKLVNDGELHFNGVFSSPSTSSIITRYFILKKEYGDWLLTDIKYGP